MDWIAKSILFFLIGGLAQLVDGTLGMGYGVATSSILISIGITPSIVSASVHTSEIFASFASGVSHFRFGNVSRNIFIPLTVFGIIGGIIGAFGLVSLPSKPVRIIVGIILGNMGILILTRFALNRDRDKVLLFYRYPNKLFLSFLGFAAAFLDAMGGGGWGPICTPSLVISGTEPRKAVGSVNLAEFFVTISITITFIILIGYENFRWDIVFFLALSGILIAPFAAYLSKKIPHHILGILVGIGIFLLSLRIILTSVLK